jgi:hypothetical protein
MKKTSRMISVEVRFHGSGCVVRTGSAFSGGVVAPDLENTAAFLVHREVQDDEGLWNPIPGEGSFPGGLQVNLWANSEGYQELGRYFLALAELDARDAPGHHEHHDGLISADGRTVLHIICRKAPREEWPVGQETG